MKQTNIRSYLQNLKHPQSINQPVFTLRETLRVTLIYNVSVFANRSGPNSAADPEFPVRRRSEEPEFEIQQEYRWSNIEEPQHHMHHSVERLGGDAGGTEEEPMTNQPDFIILLNNWCVWSSSQSAGVRCSNRAVLPIRCWMKV